MQNDVAPEPKAPTEPDKPQVPPVTDSDNSVAVEKRLRADFAELADVAAQGARLGVKLDAAEAMAKGVKPDALRRTLLEELARRSDAANLVATAPAKGAAESPIVKRAREAALRIK